MDYGNSKGYSHIKWQSRGKANGHGHGHGHGHDLDHGNGLRHGHGHGMFTARHGHGTVTAGSRHGHGQGYVKTRKSCKFGIISVLYKWYFIQFHKLLSM